MATRKSSPPPTKSTAPAAGGPSGVRRRSPARSSRVSAAADLPAVTESSRKPAPVTEPPAESPAKAAKPRKPAKVSKELKDVKEVKEAKEAKEAKAPKLHRKPVRDSFTMPEADFVLIGVLKARALEAQRETKKSELLRAGLHVLASLDTAGLIAALAQLQPVKVGRPKKNH